MNCPCCADQMVATRATQFGDEYFYCRVCKKELSELEPEKPEYNLRAVAVHFDHKKIMRETILDFTSYADYNEMLVKAWADFKAKDN